MSEKPSGRSRWRNIQWRDISAVLGYDTLQDETSPRPILANVNKQPYAIPPQWWEPKLSTTVVKLTRRYRRWQLQSRQKITTINVTGQEHMCNVLSSGHGVLITPNHAAHYDSAALYIAADQINTPLYYMTAWQVFGMASKWDQFLMQRMGCFSIDRESADRQAFKQAASLLQNEPCPLVIFPEGDIYHITDRVTPFREGAAAVALSAARRGNRPISIVPCGIKFWYVDEPAPKLHELMTHLDERLFLRPEEHKPLKARILRFAEAMLALKEIEYLGTTQAGLLTERILRLAESILDSLTSRYELKFTSRPMPDRVKELRQRIISRMDAFKLTRKRPPEDPSPEFIALSRDMDDLFFVMQLFSYPGDYLSGEPSVERLAETLDKFEEDVLDRDIPSLRGRRKVDICFGEPFLAPTGRNGRSAVNDLTQKMHFEVQRLIDQLASQTSQVGDRSEIQNPRADVAVGAKAEASA